MMALILLLLLGLVPIFIVAGVVVLIVTALSSKKKKVAGVTGESPQPIAVVPISALPISPQKTVPVNKSEPVTESKPVKAAKPVKHSLKEISGTAFQGTAALIIGMIFVVLAGLIFATTSWHTLPSFSKVFMIFGFSGLFFGASLMARKLLKIRRTGLAFYILGSIFLFLTVLAAGYFGILGDDFNLTINHRYKVLFVGALVTELALVAGIRQFADIIYTKSCFWGMSVVMYFLIKALGMETGDGIMMMACYSAVLVAADGYTKRKYDSFTTFARLHFGLFGIIAAMIAASEWFIQITFSLFINSYRAELLTTVTLGMIALGIGFLAMARERQYLQVLHSISVMAFIHFVGLSIPVSFMYQLLIGAGLSGIWFYLAANKDHPLCSTAGNGLYTLILALYELLMLLIWFFGSNSIGETLAVSVTVIMVAAAVDFWSKQYRKLRAIMPVILYPLTFMISEMLTISNVGTFRHSWIVLGFLVAVMIWDLVKHDHFWVTILVIGSLAELFYHIIGQPLPLFALAVSGYLFAKSRSVEGRLQGELEKGGCVYLVVGIYYLMETITAIRLFQMYAVTVVFVLEYIVFQWRRKQTDSSQVWTAAAIIILLMDITTYYSDNNVAFFRNNSLGPVHIVICLAIFAVFYLAFYRSGRQWAQLIAVIAILPMPFFAEWCYMLTIDEFYGWTAAVVLISGVAARRFVPVITSPDELSKQRNFDWFHILIGLDLILMTLSANAGWRTVYLVLLALYALQFVVITSLREAAQTAALVLVLLAFWTQPWMNWPAQIALEINVGAAALGIWGHGRIWNDRTDMTQFQIIEYCFCLTVLIASALSSGSVVDALIIEAVCLLIFLWANVKKQSWWLRVSGTIIVSIALYMTKSFWLSLSWWVYLLAAGLGLIAFAAVNEMKKK